MSRVRQVIGVRIDRECYGVPIETVREIVRLPPITPLPDATDGIVGIMNLRDRIIAVLDMRRRLGYPTAERSRRSRVLVVESGGGQLGLLVDQASEVVKLPEAGIEPPPAGAFGGQPDLVRGVARLDQRLLLVLDLERLVSGSVRGRVSEAATAAEVAPLEPSPGRPPAEHSAAPGDGGPEGRGAEPR